MLQTQLATLVKRLDKLGTAEQLDRLGTEEEIDTEANLAEKIGDFITNHQRSKIRAGRQAEADPIDVIQELIAIIFERNTAHYTVIDSSHVIINAEMLDIFEGSNTFTIFPADNQDDLSTGGPRIGINIQAGAETQHAYVFSLYDVALFILKFVKIKNIANRDACIRKLKHQMEPTHTLFLEKPLDHISL